MAASDYGLGVGLRPAEGTESAVVLDLGSWSIKAGVAGGDEFTRARPAYSEQLSDALTVATGLPAAITLVIASYDGVVGAPVSLRTQYCHRAHLVTGQTSDVFGDGAGDAQHPRDRSAYQLQLFTPVHWGNAIAHAAALTNAARPRTPSRGSFSGGSGAGALPLASPTLASSSSYTASSSSASFGAGGGGGGGGESSSLPNAREWGQIEELWRHTFRDRLHVDPAQRMVLLTDPPLQTRANRERVCQSLFETFQVPAMALCNSAVLALYAAGLETGVVLDVGHTQSSVVPVRDGLPLVAATRVQPLGGAHINEQLMERVRRRHLSAVRTHTGGASGAGAAWKNWPLRPDERDRINALKERVVHVLAHEPLSAGSAASFGKLLMPTPPRTHIYKLADGQSFAVCWNDDDCTRAAEPLFNPHAALPKTPPTTPPASPPPTKPNTFNRESSWIMPAARSADAAPPSHHATVHHTSPSPRGSLSKVLSETTIATHSGLLTPPERSLSADAVATDIGPTVGSAFTFLPTPHAAPVRPRTPPAGASAAASAADAVTPMSGAGLSVTVTPAVDDERSRHALLGVHRMVIQAIDSCEPALRRELYHRIVLSGGTSMTRGFPQRLCHEMENTFVPPVVTAHWAPEPVLVPPPSPNSAMAAALGMPAPVSHVHVIAPTAYDRAHSAWIGGSLLSCLSTFRSSSQVISRQLYDEIGPGVVLRDAAHLGIANAPF